SGGFSASAEAVEVRRSTHRTIAEITELMEMRRLNVVVARLMELVSAGRKAIDGGPGAGELAVRELAEAVAVMLSLFAPYTAEQMRAALGSEPSVARARWPEVDRALLVAEEVEAVVQVAGKVRGHLRVPADVDEEELRRQALRLDAVRRRLAGAEPRRVVVRAPHLVNVVPRVSAGRRLGAPGGSWSGGTGRGRGRTWPGGRPVPPRALPGRCPSPAGAPAVRRRPRPGRTGRRPRTHTAGGRRPARA